MVGGEGQASRRSQGFPARERMRRRGRYAVPREGSDRQPVAVPLPPAARPHGHWGRFSISSARNPAAPRMAPMTSPARNEPTNQGQRRGGASSSGAVTNIPSNGIPRPAASSVRSRQADHHGEHRDEHDHAKDAQHNSNHQSCDEGEAQMTTGSLRPMSGSGVHDGVIPPQNELCNTKSTRNGARSTSSLRRHAFPPATR